MEPEIVKSLVIAGAVIPIIVFLGHTLAKWGERDRRAKKQNLETMIHAAFMAGWMANDRDIAKRWRLDPSKAFQEWREEVSKTGVQPSEPWPRR